jgi:two-component system, response regulator
LTPDQAILLVEDNDDDFELTLLAFREARVKNPVVRARDGVEALDYLFCRENYATRDPREVPAIVLLDLNLPRLGGLEVLKTIRADDRTRYLPVVILTSSAEERDRLDAYTLYANSYVQKPVDYDRFVTATRGLGLYWLLLNQPPPPRAP